MSFIHMNVPLVFWGKRPPSHKITCICRSEERKGVATGSESGQICLWDVYRDHENEKIRLRPRCLLFGGISAIKSLCFVKTFSGDRDRIASLSEKGTVSVWDGKDGACLKYVLIPGCHTGIKALSRVRYSETLLVLYGQYSSIFILDSSSLDTLCVLRTSCKPNWNNHISFLISSEKKDHLLSLTVEGVAKMWLLPPRNEMRELGEMTEEKTTKLTIQRPLHVTSCSSGGYSTTLIVCNEVWQIYNTTNAHMKLLMIRACEESVSGWIAGEFIDYQTILVWGKGDGKAYVYRLSARCVPGLNESDDSIEESTTSGCSLVYTLAPPQATPTSSHFKLASYMDYTWCCQGDHTGRLYLWNIQKLRQEPPLSHSNVPVPPDAHACVADSWKSPAQPCGLTDMLYPPTMYPAPPSITCAVYLAAYGRLVCGQDDGSIAVLSATQAATVLMLQSRKFSRGWPQYCILKGHRNKVNHLLYPSGHSPAYHSDYLVSGGSDFTVKLWDLFHGDLIHTFAVHGGGVKSIVTCPADINPRLQTCVCSIAEDNSVAILSTSERKCLLVAAVHSSPVRDVAWRLNEDFLLVSCTDGKLYVWQIETGSLDRCVEGETARLVLSTAQEASSLRSSSTMSSSTSFPLQVRSLKAGEGDSLIQVLVFDPQSLINRLGKMEKIEDKGGAQPKKQADAFRTWLSARRHFGAGVGPGGGGGGGVSDLSRRRTSAPAVVVPPARGRGGGGGGGGSEGHARPENERAREMLGKAVASQNKIEQLQEEAPITTVNIVRLLLSCLHAWSLDPELDQDCEEVLGLVRPCRPVSFGLLSKGQCLSLVLPGWNLKPCPSPDDQSNLSSTVDETTPTGGRSEKLSFDQKCHIRWQLSRSLTTQHLLTMVSVTNTLMNQSIGAHVLATSSGVRKHKQSESEDSDWSDSEESQTMRDNQIRAVWSQVAALHCVMLPERMEGRFRAPHLPVLASRFLDHCQAIREASQALLQAELRRIHADGRKKLVMEWAGRLQAPATPYRGSGERQTGAHITLEDGELSISAHSSAIPTQQQQTTALIILGMIGAEFCDGKSKRRPPSSAVSSSSVSSESKKRLAAGSENEVMDQAVARVTAKTLQAVLLEKPSSRAPLHSNLRCSAAELLGRGFHLWEKYVDIPQVVMGLLDLVVSPNSAHHSTGSGSNKYLRFVSEVAHKALNLMILVRPVTMVATLAKEVAMFLASQHITHAPHSSLQPIQVGVTPPPSTAGIITQSNALLPMAKTEILHIMKTVIEKCSAQVSLQLLEVMDVILFCLEQEQVKKKNLIDLFPVIFKLPNISYSIKTRKVAVGARSGQVGIYDLKQGKTLMMNAHSHPVTVLLFSDDGKLLATYAYGDSTLSVWQLSSSLFGSTSQPKLVNSWPAISSSSPMSYASYIRLEWSGTKSVILHMPGGVECKYSL